MSHDTHTDPFEQLVRTQLHRLADFAPAEVRDVHDPGDLRAVDLVPLTPRRSPRRRIAAIGGAAIALAGGLTLTGLAATGGEEGGGNTPQEAVSEFVEALEQSDVLGALDVIDPGESAVLIDLVTRLVEDGTRVGLFAEGADAGAVTGATANVDGLELTVDQVATDVAVVTFAAGTAQLSFDFAALPLGAQVTALVDPTSADAETTAIDFATDPLRIATVERNGRWYVSFAFSIAEAARRSADLPFPVEAGVRGNGFDSPDAAATAFWTHVAALDVDAALASLAPGEADAIGRYAPLWVPGLDESIAAARDSGLAIDVSGLEFDVTTDGDRRTVVPTAYVIAGTLPPASDPGMPPFQPDGYTMVFVEDGSAFYLFEPGEAIPESFDDLEPTNDFPVELQSGEVPTNSATLYDDGTLQKYWTDVAAVDDAAPRPFRIELADGCTTMSGALAEDALLWSPLPDGVDDLGDGRYRSCDIANAPSTISVFGLVTLGRSGLLAPTLPTIEVVDVGGRWYVSPVGSIGAQLLGLIADVDDGQILSIDSPVAAWVYGVDRATLESRLVDRPADQLGPECTEIVDVGADGAVVGLRDDAAANAVRRCTESESFWGGLGDGDSAISVEYGVGPADAEPAESELAEVEPAVTESTVVTVATSD